MPSRQANFCSHCGTALDGSHNYCPLCGTQCRETTPAESTDTTRTTAAASTDAPGTTATEPTATRTTANESTSQGTSVTDQGERDAFRRRVEAYLVDGWEMESDRGDSVLIRNPEYGSVGVHILLLIFTGGVGNLAYGWYKYTKGGERRILRVDGDDTVGIPSDVANSSGGTVGVSSSVAGYVGGAFSLLMGALFLTSASVPLVLLGVFFIVAALWMMPATRRRWKNRHPPTTFGHVHSTDETTRVDPDKPCVVCSKAVQEGVERSYREEYVFAGIPLFTTDSGENQYCRSCASGGLSEYDEPSTATEDPVVDTEY